MAAAGKRKGLGRGLSSLLGEDTAAAPTAGEATGQGPLEIPIEFLQPGKYQPRHQMDAEDIDDLARSIAEKGILQPILVRRLADGDNAYEIIAGERRWRAAQIAKLHQVPVLIKDLNDRETLEIALVENLQRQDLSALEEAEGYKRLMDEFTHTQEGLAKAVGKSRSHVANILRLLGLPKLVKQLLDRGDISAGHARALLNAAEPEALALRVVKDGLNVRQTEKLAQDKGGKAKKTAKATGQSSDTLALERDLTSMLGLKVGIRDNNGKGALTIHYQNLEQLDDLLHRLSHGVHAAAEADQAALLDPVGEDDLAAEMDLPDDPF